MSKKRLIRLALMTLMLSSATAAFAIPISVVLTTPLPATSAIATPITTVYTLTNNLPFSESPTFTTNDSAFVVTGCSSIAPNTPCTLTGTYTPVISGPHSLVITMHYDINTVPFDPQSTVTAVPLNKMVAVDKCSPSSPFYCTTIQGSAFNGPITVGFDTGDSRLVVPDGCVNPQNTQVIDWNMTDPWGKPSKLVEGQVQLQAQDGTLYTVNNMYFYANLDKACNDPTATQNFGASPEERNDSNESDSDTYCIYSFFNMYDYSGLNLAPGFALTPADPQTGKLGDHMLLQMGVNPVATNLFRVSLANQSVSGCTNPSGSSQTYPSFTNSDGVDFAFTVPNATITVASSSAMPATSAPSAAAPLDSSVPLTGLASMLDTGGGMLILNDQNGTLETTLAAFIQQAPSPVSWLDACVLIQPGTTIAYSAQDTSGHTLSYQYTVADFNANEEKSAAICPLPNPSFPTTPWVSLNGANVGFEAYAHLASLTLNIDPANGGGFLAISQ